MKKVLILSLALILLLGVAAHGTFGLFSDTETSTGNTFTAWVEEVVCAKLNVADEGEDKIYKYDDTGAFVGSFNLSSGNGRPAGVASVGDYIYVLDQADKQVYKYTCSGTLLDVSKTLKKQTVGGLGNPYGLAIYGDDMWVIVWGQDFIMHHYSLSTAFAGSGDINADSQIAPHANNTQPTGLAIDDNYLYVVDYGDKQVYRYPDTGGSATISKVLKEAGGGDLDSPTGAMLGGTSLWVVDSGTDMVYQYNLTDLFDGSGTNLNATSEFDLHVDNEDASGL